MKQIIYLSVASSLLMLASGCSDEQFGVTPTTYENTGTIVFSNGGAKSRASEPGRTPADIPYVMVSADLDKGKGKSTYFYDYQFDRVGSGANALYTSSRNPIWPPVGMMTFKAYYPSLTDMYEANYTWEGAVPSPTIDDNLVIHNFAVAKNNACSIDLMTATPTVDVETFDTKNSVELNLKHQLTSLEIHAFNGSKTGSTTDPNTNVITTSWGHIIEIAGIRIKNIPMVGDFDINSSEWLTEKTQTTTLEYIFQPNDKILKMGRLGEHNFYSSTSGSPYTYYYNQNDTKEKAVNLLNYYGMESLTMLPTAALPVDKEDGEAKKIELQLLIRIIQDTDVFDGGRVHNLRAIYPYDIGYRYNDDNGYYLTKDGNRYIQSDRDDSVLDHVGHTSMRDTRTEPILLKDDKIDNIMEYLVEERERGPGDQTTTFTVLDENGVIIGNVKGTPWTCIIKDFVIMESAEHYGNNDHYFDRDEISIIRNTKPYSYGDGGYIPLGCIRRFAWLDIPLTVKDKDGNNVNIACEAGKKYKWTIDFTNSLKNVTQVTPPDPNNGDSEQIDPKELGKFAIELSVTVTDWENEAEETVPGIGSYTPTPSAE